LLPAASLEAAPAPDDGVELVLLEQDFAVTANGRWQATFELQGDVGELPLTTTTTTPETSTTAAATVDPAAPTASTAGETTTQTTGRSGGRAPTQQAAEVWVVAYLPIADRDALAEFIDGDDRNAIDALPLTPSVHEAGGRTELRVDAPTTVQPSAPRRAAPAEARPVPDRRAAARRRRRRRRAPHVPGTSALRCLDRRADRRRRAGCRERTATRRR
jgi:hypothetical protein